MAAPRYPVEQILDRLNREPVRCTYGAVGEVLGVIPLAVGRHLGGRRPEASWVVRVADGQPTGYAAAQKHPELESKKRIIRTGEELRRLVERQ